MRNLISGIANLAKAPMRLALRSAALRKRIAFELIQDYYQDLGIVVPLRGGIRCPIVSMDHWVSFDHIFCEGEYDEIFRRIPLPARWLDLGCHAGHFSLEVISRHASQQRDRRELRALLIDADSRVIPAIAKIIACNSFDSNMIRFLPGAITSGSGDVRFEQKEFMTSEVKTSTNGSDGSAVPSIDERTITSQLPPPYDLVKLDVEGAEYAFFSSYQAILEQTRHIVFEWHSWHPGGGGKSQLLKMGESLGFELEFEPFSDLVVRRNGAEETIGVALMRNRRAF